MRTLDFNKVLQDFQYKPNFTFGAYRRDGRWWIRVVMLVEDARKPFERWEVKPAPQDQDEFTWYMDRFIPSSPNGVGFSPSRELVRVEGNYFIPEFIEGEDDRFVQWMVSTVRRLEDHETFEWLRYKGELINDPHKL